MSQTHALLPFSCAANLLPEQVLSKLLQMSRNGPYRFERILGKFLSTLDTDDTDNALQNGKIYKMDIVSPISIYFIVLTIF